MKRTILFVCIVWIVLCSLTSCKSNKTGSVKNGAIVFGSIVTNLTEWTGEEAFYEDGDKLKIRYYLCNNNIEDCVHNTAGVLKENMTKHKKAFYYTLYLQTYVYMYYPVKGGYIEGEAIIEEDSGYSISQVVEMMYTSMGVIQLSDSVKSVTFNEKVTLNTEAWGFKARPEELIIPSLIRVQEDDGKITMSTTTQINGVTVGKTSTEKYDYYKHDNILIQVALGTDITTLVILLEE